MNSIIGDLVSRISLIIQSRVTIAVTVIGCRITKLFLNLIEKITTGQRYILNEVLKDSLCTCLIQVRTSHEVIEHVSFVIFRYTAQTLVKDSAIPLREVKVWAITLNFSYYQTILQRVVFRVLYTVEAETCSSILQLGSTCWVTEDRSILIAKIVERLTAKVEVIYTLVVIICCSYTILYTRNTQVNNTWETIKTVLSITHQIVTRVRVRRGIEIFCYVVYELTNRGIVTMARIHNVSLQGK